MILKYFKGTPNLYIIRYRAGEIEASGAGINFWYWPWNTSIAVVPLASQEAPFIFNETTANYQEITIQGSLTYRLEQPLVIAGRLDYTIDPATGRYRSDDPDKLIQRVVNAVQSQTRSLTNDMEFEQALTRVKHLATSVYSEIGAAPVLQALGIHLENLHFHAVKATSEMQKALETDHREALHKRADQAIYARRAAAVAEERKIRESEINTEVEIENRRSKLVDTQARNNLALAEAEAKADELKLSPYGALPPQALIGLALREWAGNAGTIANLSITPDLLSKVVTWVADSKQA